MNETMAVTVAFFACANTVHNGMNAMGRANAPVYLKQFVFATTFVMGMAAVARQIERGRGEPNG